LVLAENFNPNIKNDFDNEKIWGLDNPATVMHTEKEKLALEQYLRLETGEISRAT
jgi:hypothetical protein